jgi:hypothetical protein
MSGAEKTFLVSWVAVGPRDTVQTCEHTVIQSHNVTYGAKLVTALSADEVRGRFWKKLKEAFPEREIEINVDEEPTSIKLDRIGWVFEK